MALRILLIDDNARFVEHFRLLSGDTFALRVAASPEAGMPLVANRSVDAVLLDIELGGAVSGLEVLARIRGMAPDLPVLMVTSDDSRHSVARARELGADEYLKKGDIDLERLHDAVATLVENALWRLHARDLQHGEDLVGAGPAMRRLRRDIEAAARGGGHVVIRGERGTESVAVAAAVHAGSDRRNARFVRVDGAQELHFGRLRLADRGTVFVAGLDAFDPESRDRLLDVLETGCLPRTDGAEPCLVDVRGVLAVTASSEPGARPMDESGAMARLRPVALRVPPLRERLEDLPDLTRAIVARICRGDGRTPVAVREDAIERLRRHAWPGNVGELELVLRCALAGGGGALDAGAVATQLPPPRAGRD